MKKLNKRGKKGQMQIPFSMIFSIILIIAFIAVAFYAIKVFLDMKKCTQLGLFKEDLQTDIDSAWTSEETSSVFKGNLPGAVDLVCFVDRSKSIKGQDKDIFEERYVPEDKNLFFYPYKDSCKDLRTLKLKHIDIAKITENDNPYCINNIKGQAEIIVEKGFYEDLVKLR